MELNLDIIKELINSLDASSLDTLHLETEDFKLSLERKADKVCDNAPASSTFTANSQVVVQPAAEKKEEEEKQCGTIVKSPIVGTFYDSPAPDKPPFVRVGQKVKCGDTLFIVESMKLMNEITSECEGTVAEIFVKNGQTVEYGQPIMRIE
jgi:acetyl-CoA carboxylase, biotin carboxyl carrier protein